MNLRISVIIGGADLMKQGAELANIPHIVIATPGRLAHILDEVQCDLEENLQNLKYLVLDEADRMLGDDSFKIDLKRILKVLPSPRQTLLFSATRLVKLDKYVPLDLIFG